MKRDKRCKLVRDLISSLDIGMEIVDVKGKHPIHINTRDTLERCYKSIPHDEWWRHLERLDNDDLRDHFEGRKTYYFAGNEKEERSLVMVDVDCKRRGSLAGALGFCQSLQALIPGMPSEPSTHGRGGHGYFIFDRGSLPPAAANEMLKALEKRLRGEMNGHDIENVEIKGLIPVIRFQTRHDRVIESVTVKEGTLAKLPRTLTYEQLKDLPVVTVAQLQKLIKDVEEEPKGRVMRVVPAGSIAGKYITPEMLEWLPKYETLADTLMEHHALPVSSGRGVATAKDIAILLLILEFFNEKPNPDGSMPYERIKGMWNALWQAGDIDRKWDDKRYASSRNYLSSLGLIDWRDASYKMPIYLENKKIAGQAARWGLSGQMLRLLEAVKCDSQTVKVATIDNQGRGETSLSVTRINEFIASLEQKMPADTIKPHLEDEICLSVDEITAMVAPFEEWAMAA